MPQVTRESIAAMLNNDNPAYVQAVIGRALVALLKNQTATEQAAATTNENNGIGFTGGDAFGGTLTAKYYIKHKRLLDWQVEKWLKLGSNGYPRLAKYHKQLNACATKSKPTTAVQYAAASQPAKINRIKVNSDKSDKLKTAIDDMTAKLKALNT